jgi:hypothetical protein
MFQRMSFVCPDAAADGGEAARRQCDAWRQVADTLRRAAAIVDQPATDVAAFDRDDVWRGAIASSFRHDLDQWRGRLGGDGGISLATDLVAAAARIDARIAALGAGPPDAPAGGGQAPGPPPGGGR